MSTVKMDPTETVERERGRQSSLLRDRPHDKLCSIGRPTMAAVDEQRMLAAIAAIRTVIRRHIVSSDDEKHRVINAIRSTVERVRETHTEEITRLRIQIEQLLLPIDPLCQTWNVFRLFDLEYEETRWTRWLAGILTPDNGLRCSQVAWKALCETVSLQATLLPPIGCDNLANAGYWAVASTEVPQVECEVSDPEFGRLDLLVTTHSLVVAIENKLWAHWHDGPNGKQADRYRALAQKRLVRNSSQRLGLLLLSQRSGLTHGRDYPSDYIHVSWRSLGQGLRRGLRREWSSDQYCLAALWPIVLTLVSIEQDLLELKLDTNLTEATIIHRVRVLKELAQVAEYLEGGESRA